MEEDITEFIKLIQQLNEQQKTGLYLALQGLNLIDKKKTAPKRSS